ncbi:hypothetical protein GGR55DRAFT_700856 [Xylaria sp. FL0064]|nr:hypothetical protein GGR55DRAFT_700856 [Xylaria sp. FL0064]
MTPVRAEPPVCTGLCFIQCEQTPFVFDSLHEHCQASQAVILGESDPNEIVLDQEMLASHMNVDSVDLNEMYVENTAYSADVSEYEVLTTCEKETQSCSPNTMINDSPNPMVEAPIADDQAERTSDWSPCMETNFVSMDLEKKGSLSQLREQEAFETFIRQDMFDGEEEVATQHEETPSK